MAAFDPATLERWRALAIVDRDGTTVGTISEFYLDRETGYPTWALVNTGLFGATQTFVPLIHATEIGDGLQVPYEKNHIKDTPKVDLHDELSPQEEAQLFAHYGVDYEPSGEAGSDERSELVEGRSDGAADPGSGEGPGPVWADAGSVGSATAMATGFGLAGVAAAAGTEPESSERPDGEPAATSTEAGSSERPAVAYGASVTDEGPGPVPAEPGSIDSAEAANAAVDPARAGTTGTVPVGPGPVGPGSGAATGQRDAGSEAVPAEPGTTEPDETTRAESQRFGTDAGGSVGFESSADHPEHQADPDPSQITPLHNDRGGATVLDPDPDRSVAPPDPGQARSQATGHDPELGRTAPVEPGLPGSTAASPYGRAPTTIDKAAYPSGAEAEEPLRVPGEAGWAPGAAGSFEEHEPFDRQPGASDRWREAKLAAERERIARAAAAQPEERSPLERARRRLERLVGGGQDDPDPDEISPADRETAERARRARLGLDEDDRRH